MNLTAYYHKNINETCELFNTTNYRYKYRYNQLIKIEIIDIQLESKIECNQGINLMKVALMLRRFVRNHDLLCTINPIFSDKEFNAVEMYIRGRIDSNLNTLIRKELNQIINEICE